MKPQTMKVRDQSGASTQDWVGTSLIELVVLAVYP